MEKENGYDVYYKPEEVWEIVCKSTWNVVLAENNGGREFGTKVVACKDEGEIQFYYYFGWTREYYSVGNAKNAQECELIGRYVYECLFGYKCED